MTPLTLARPDRAIPPVPLALGLAGLLPFWGLSVARVLHLTLDASGVSVGAALATYAAVILSFLGGIRWGLAVAGRGTARDYAISVVPSLVAWSLLAAPDPWRLVLLGLVILALGPIDLDLVRRDAAPPWFGRLRLILSSGAGIALLLAAWG